MSKKKERSQQLDQKKPVPEMFRTFEKDIASKYKVTSVFLNELNTYIQGLPNNETKDFTLKGLIQKFVDHTELYVSDKDRIYRRLKVARPDLVVKTIIATSKNNYSVGVRGRNNKPGNLWVEITKAKGKEDIFTYGSGVVEIAKI